MPGFCKDIDGQTAAAHKMSIESVVMQKYLKKQLRLQEHIDYLLQIYYVFARIEELLPLYKNKLIFADGLYDLVVGLKRKEAIHQDYQYASRLAGRSAVFSREKLWPETQAILADLDRCASVDQEEKFLAHIYVQYRALTNGGPLVLKGRTKDLLRCVSSGNSEAKEDTQGVAIYLFGNYSGAACDRQITKIFDRAYDNNRIQIPSFVSQVKKVYRLTIAQVNHGGLSYVERVSQNVHQFWRAHQNVIRPVLTVAAVATTAYLAACK